MHAFHGHTHHIVTTVKYQLFSVARKAAFVSTKLYFFGYKQQKYLNR